MPISTGHWKKCAKCGKMIYVLKGDNRRNELIPDVCEDCRKNLNADDIWANVLGKLFPFR